MTTAFQDDAWQVDAFQIDAGATPVVVEVIRQGRGNWDKFSGKKRKPKVMRYSDVASREAIAAALKVPSEPRTVFIEPESPIGDENDDDAILLAVVSKLIH